MADLAAAIGDQAGGVAEEDRRVGVPPFRVVGRKVLADIAGAKGAKKRIG